MLSFLTII